MSLAVKIVKLYRQLQASQSVDADLLYDVQQDLVELGIKAIRSNENGMLGMYDEATIRDVTVRWTKRVNELARARAPGKIVIAIDNLLNEWHTDAIFLDQVPAGVCGGEIYNALVTLVDRGNRGIKR
jgi:hypothetical protein